MKSFSAPSWDSDADDHAYHELFKGLSRKNKSKVPPNREEKQKKLKRLLKKQFQDLKSNDVNVITVQTKIELSKAQNKKDHAFKIDSEDKKKEKKLRKKCKKSKAEVSSDSDDLDQEVTKKQKKMLKKYSSELNSLNSHSDKLTNELLKEKKRQKKLKRKLEREAKKQILLNKTLEVKLKEKRMDLIKKKIKIEPIESSRPSSSTMIDNRTKKTREKEKAITNVNIPESLRIIKKIKLQEKLKTILSQAEKKEQKPILTLRQKMMEKLKAARFRFLNEQIYKTDSKEAQKIFKSDPEAFVAYHEGYRQQVKSWPMNPLGVIIKTIKKMPKNYIIADFGCGDAKLAKSVDQKVYSFDLVAIDNTVMACDMANTPLPDTSIDVAVFCLSLMGTNIRDYLLEANRVLKLGGVLKIAEVESRFDSVETFIEGVQHFGFKNTWKDLSHNLFYFLDFKKVLNVKNKKKLPTISLLPCLYKKR